jgi:ribonuclease HII
MRQQTLLDLPSPDLFRLERSLRAQGIHRIAGIDEAGRGCLAGPVVAAAAILPSECCISGLKDSKLLSARERDRLFDEIVASAIAWSVGIVDSREIDRINILQATLRAMREAVDGLAVEPEHLLIDGDRAFGHHLPRETIIKGDKLSGSIAAASILAKVTRDRLMIRAEEAYPQFRFSVHKGYGTPEHFAELTRCEPTPIHRMTFRGVAPR